jgi:4-hydroxythreonine-4-phosphate dehydrogenase
MKTFVFTCGDINGIGPEIVIKAINRVKDTDNRFIIIIPENIFENVSSAIQPLFEFAVTRSKKPDRKKQVTIISLRKAVQEYGTTSKISGEVSFKAIQLSFQLLKEKKADAVITAPISKLSLRLAGIHFPGHTEMYAEWSRQKNYLMMFLSDDMKAALNSIHIPLKNVSKETNKKNLFRNIQTAITTLKYDLGIHYPKVAVLGLNPHAGEDGVIGKEEKKIISPVISEIQEAEGPFSPDAFFANKLYKKYDLVFGMYHDQVLIPFKLMNFEKGVNYTAGLPFIRTSPDHGTAFDIAGRGIADESSMLEAFRYAEIIAANRSTRW